MFKRLFWCVGVGLLATCRSAVTVFAEVLEACWA